MKDVCVYWDPFAKCWSVQGKYYVCARWANVAMIDVTFKVSEAGRAFACGEALQGAKIERLDGPPLFGVGVSYNPDRAGFFYVTDRNPSQYGREVKGGTMAWLDEDRTVRVLDPVYGERNAFDPREEAE
jgi:hypothetical protein